MNKENENSTHLVDKNIIKEMVANSPYNDKEKKTLEIFANRFNKELYRHCIEKDTNQEDFAKDIGVAPSTLSNYRMGKRFPETRMLKSISEKLNVSLDYLFGITELKSTDIEDKVINEKTSLNDESIKVLTDCTEAINYNGDDELYQIIKEASIDTIKAINYLIQNENTTRIFFNIASYLWHNFHSENEIPALASFDDRTLEFAIENRTYKREFEIKDLNRIPIIKIEEKLYELKLQEENKKEQK